MGTQNPTFLEGFYGSFTGFLGGQNLYFCGREEMWFRDVRSFDVGGEKVCRFYSRRLGGLKHVVVV